MLGPQPGNIHVDWHAVDNFPFTGNHDPVGLMRTAKHQSREWIAGPGKPQIFKRIERQIGLFANRDFSDVGPPETGRGSLRCPSKRVEMGNIGRIVGQPVDHQSVAHTFHEIGIVIGSRPVDPQPDRTAGLFEFLRPALA